MRAAKQIAIASLPVLKSAEKYEMIKTLKKIKEF